MGSGGSSNGTLEAFALNPYLGMTKVAGDAAGLGGGTDAAFGGLASQAQSKELQDLIAATRAADIDEITKQEIIKSLVAPGANNAEQIGRAAGALQAAKSGSNPLYADRRAKQERIKLMADQPGLKKQTTVGRTLLAGETAQSSGSGTLLSGKA